MINNFKKILFLFIALLVVGATNVKAKDVLVDGKLYMDSIKPSSKEEAYDMISAYLMSLDGITIAYPYMNDFNSDFTSGKICIEYDNGTNQTLENVPIIYKDGNDTIKAKIKKFASSIERNKTFALNDLEIINYWKNSNKDTFNQRGIMANYSGELKQFLGNGNIRINFDTATGMGEDGEFFNAILGDAVLGYNGIVYSKTDAIGAILKNVIYVDSSVANTEDELMAAAQKRINDYLKDESVVITKGGDINTILTGNDSKTREFTFLGITDAQYYFNITVDGNQHKIIIIQDSTKMVTPVLKTADLETNIEISTNNTSVPLDTYINSNKLTSGDEYNKIMNVIKNSNIEVFDLKLYSGSLEDYFTNLDNDDFEVKIPITDKFKNKDLIAYYVNDKNEKVGYKVDIKGNFAVFKTNHFSVYTLAAIGDSSNVDNPKTLDNIINYLVIGVISLFGLIISKIHLKKRFN